MYYHANASRLRYAPLYIQLAAAGGIALLGGVVCAVTHIHLAPSPGAVGMLSTINGNMAALALRASNCALLVAALLLVSAVLCYRRTPDTVHPAETRCTYGTGTCSQKSAASVLAWGYIV